MRGFFPAWTLAAALMLGSSATFGAADSALAAPGWTGRVIVTPILGGLGARSQAQIALEKV